MKFGGYLVNLPHVIYNDIQVIDMVSLEFTVRTTPKWTLSSGCKHNTESKQNRIQI